MNEAAMTQYLVDTFADVHPVTAWGDTFFFYNPDRTQPDKVYFATLKTQDDDYDRASELNRPGVFRLNIGLSGQTYRALFGEQAAREDDAAAEIDFTVLDQLLPHPVYGRAHWVCVLNPSEATFATLQPLLAEAYQRAVARVIKRAARG